MSRKCSRFVVFKQKTNLDFVIFFAHVSIVLSNKPSFVMKANQEFDFEISLFDPLVELISLNSENSYLTLDRPRKSF